AASATAPTAIAPPCRKLRRLNSAPITSWTSFTIISSFLPLGARGAVFLRAEIERTAVASAGFLPSRAPASCALNRKCARERPRGAAAKELIERHSDHDHDAGGDAVPIVPGANHDQSAGQLGEDHRPEKAAKDRPAAAKQP